MVEKRKNKKKGKEVPVEEEEEPKPSKLEYSVANNLRKNLPTKKTKFLNKQVQYFTASKAVDYLLDSDWAKGKDPIFTDRDSVVRFCDRLLRFKFFHRAKKIPITDKDLKPKELRRKKEKEREERKKKQQEESSKEEEEEKEKEEKEKEENNEEEETNQEGKDKKKKKAKIKLDMHLHQAFVDGSDAYVWMHEVTPFYYPFLGLLLLIGVVAVSAMPLWPPSVRKGVYYLSMAAAGFLALIVGLAVLRFIIFIILWALSMGRHHFWILPNLTEDVGFLASFWPLYQYEYRGSDYKKKKSKKKKKQEDEDQEQQQEELLEKEDKKSDNEEIIENDTSANEDDEKIEDTEGENKTGGDANTSSETESENSNSQTFEMVNKEDISDSYDPESSHP